MIECTVPKINRKYLSEKPIKYKSESREHTSEFYNSAAWRRLRNTFLSTRPICACCLEFGKVTPATVAHHKIPWDRGITEEEKWNLFLKESNLMPVCDTCHHALHFKDKQYHLGSLDSLTDIEYRYAHGLNYTNS